MLFSLHTITGEYCLCSQESQTDIEESLAATMAVSGFALANDYISVFIRAKGFLCVNKKQGPLLGLTRARDRFPGFTKAKGNLSKFTEASGQSSRSTQAQDRFSQRESWKFLGGNDRSECGTKPSITFLPPFHFLTRGDYDLSSSTSPYET